MMKFVFVVSFIVISTCSIGEAVTCYHCYDSFNYATATAGNVDGPGFGYKLIRCDKNQNKWNSWECPAKWPVCVIVYGKVLNHYEIVRTCGEKNFCSNYIPPIGVKVTSCRECNTTLCNDYAKIDPPVEPEAMFTFNFNINLQVNKYRVRNLDNEADSQ